MPALKFCRAVELSKAHALMSPGPVVLISSAHGGLRNVMTAAWSMPLDFSPAKVAIVVDRQHFTRELMEKSGEFVLNIPPKSLLDKVMAAGSQSGRGHDKFAACGLEAVAAAKVAAPLVAGCVGWLECRIVPEAHNQQAHDLFIAEVVAAWADERAFHDGCWQPCEESLRPLHYLSGNRFMVMGTIVEAPAA